MTIECPNCQARYEVRLPPEGRTVRCARCKTVWRAMPQDDSAPGALNGVADAAHHESASDHDSAFANSNHTDETEAQHANSHASHETGSLTSHSFDDEGAHERGGSVEQSNTNTFETVSSYNQGSVDHSSLSADSQAKSSIEAEGGHNPQERIVRVNEMQSHVLPFRSSMSSFQDEFEVAGPANELQTLEEARAAVRDVFSSLNDAARPINGSPYVEPVLTPSGEVAADRSRFSVFSPESARYYSDNSGATEASLFQSTASEDETASHAGENQGFDNVDREESGAGDDALNGSSEEEDAYRESESSTDNADDEETSLSGASDNTSEATVIRQMATKSLSDEEADAAIRAALTRHYARDNLEPVQNQDYDLASQLEAQLKSKPMPREDGDNRLSELQNRPGLPLESLAYTEFNRDDREDAAEPGAENRVDEELLQQLERTKPAAVEARRGGGLLLAAAWGLFLSVAGGLIGGGLAFRDIAAEALPGLAPVYRYLGMPVTVQPLSFDNVRYEWSMTASRPTLVILGAVVNKANRKVKTPDFYLTVKDQDPQLDREYSIPLPVDGAKIRAKQQADFRIELVAPNPSITAVELELRNVE